MRTLSRKGGFSLVELLTVIAIIAILAAIIFPVMSTVKKKADENNCASNLHQIAMAVQMFKQDNRRYPDVLSARAVSGQSLENQMGQDGALFGEYVKSYKILHCRTSKVTNTTDIVSYESVPGDAGSTISVYAYDSYSCFPWGSTVEPHYCVKWATQLGDVDNYMPYPPNNPPSDAAAVRQQDYERQLRWRNPPDHTLVTWCSYHEIREGTNPAGWRGNAIAVFLDGSLDKFPANEMERCKWRIRPKKS